MRLPFPLLVTSRRIPAVASIRRARLLAWLLTASPAPAQDVTQPGHSIGKVSTLGDLIVMEVEPGALGRANLFDLQGRTLRFSPAASGYRVENRALHWDADFGNSSPGPAVTLHQFAFPFSGTRWTSFIVGTTGSIRFGGSGNDVGLDPYGKPEGVTIGRFDQLADAATTLIEGAPAICVFLKPRLSGPHYVKELSDRAVITWDLTEPFGGILDFTWFPTVNRFQAVLHRDGSIEMSYQELSARDAIVGVYPTLSRREKPLATLRAGAHPSLAPQLDLRAVTLSSIDDVLVRVTFTTRGPLPSDGDSAIERTGYRVAFEAPPMAGRSDRSASWVVRGMRDPYDPSGGPPRYFVFGRGVSPNATVSGSSLTIEGVLPPRVRGADRIAVSAEVFAGADGKTVERLPARDMAVSALRGPEVHLASLTRGDGPFPVVYEAFHYAALPTPQDLSCTVIRALGDRFDFLVYYSDFRIDSQEASSPSFGPAAGNVTGIGLTQHDLESYCSRGRFQWAFAQPVYVGANEMYEKPPEGAPVGSKRDITYYLHRLAAASANGKPLPYNYAMSHVGHEMAHRWAAYVSARVDGRNIPLGPWPHWGPGLQAPVAFPYQLPIEASTLGGGVWRDNLDGTYTQLRDGYFVPATGYSPLDLYLMGFLAAAEVPDFFVLTHLAPAGRDSSGHAVFRADRTRVTVGDVIAAEGPRDPDPSRSQRSFNTGVVIVVEHGRRPTRALVERANGVRLQWVRYWQRTTGGRASMTTDPH